MKQYYIPYFPGAKKHNLLQILYLYNVAEYDKGTRLYNKITFQSLDDLTKRINEAAGKEKVTPVQITKYLLENGYLKMEFDHKTKTRNRVPTEKGTALGIENFWEINKFYREYSKNYYSEDAQRFIIEHLNEIIMIPQNEAYKNE